MKKGDRDIVWDELEALFGPVTNQANRGRRNRATKLIKESILALAGSERFPRNDQQVVDEIRRRYGRLTQLWPGLPPTDIWLASRWDAADPGRPLKPEGASGPVRIADDGYTPAPAEVAKRYLKEWHDRHG